jgi:phosphate transport system substrate-binding protein
VFLVPRSAALLLLAVCVAGCGRSDGPRLDGGGATFIEPLMLKWQRVYEHETGVQVDYTGTGSGNGVQQMTRQAILFGCTDAPMNREQREKALGINGDVVHVPLTLGAVVPIYHLNGVPEERPLRFTGPLLADIFLGIVTRWNDPAIGEVNPGVTLPDLPIKVVSRSDPSGTTAIFAEYLAKMRPTAWKERNMGIGTAVSFDVGIRQKGNPGVAGEVGRLDGAIGYVELAFAMHMNDRVMFGVMRNRAGKFVVASPESVTAAATALDEIPADMCFSVVDTAGRDAYPISGADWAVFYRRLPADRGKPLVAFLRWATAGNGGQQYAAPLGYAPLPDRIIDRIGGVLASVEYE